ncbi:hypothetical protein [Kutzneria kofuensis]
MGDYDSLVAAAEAVPLHGWDFGWVSSRTPNSCGWSHAGRCTSRHPG